MHNSERPLDEVTGAIVDSALRIHRTLGPGLLESVYEAVLARDLLRRGITVEKQKCVSFEFEELKFEDAFRLDLLINFGAPTLKQGLRRIVNGVPGSASPHLRINRASDV